VSALPNRSPDGLDPEIRGQIAEIVQESGYGDAVREFRLKVKDGSAFEGAASSPEDIEKRVDRYR
jgi:hypothetical protein